MSPKVNLKMNYDPNCIKCDRLSDYLSLSKKKYPDYFCKPVPAFGDKNVKLLIVGLAPGLHGANKTGRPFTGDHAGIILYFGLDFDSSKLSIFFWQL